MPEPARIIAEAQAPPPETSKRNNAPKIPSEYDDELSRLYEELKNGREVAKALKALHPGLDCDRYSVIRRVNWLRNQRQRLEQSVLLREDAIRAGSEAVVALERLRLQYGDVVEHLVASWEDSNREEAAFDCKVAASLRGAIREHSRMLADAQKALAKADELEERAEKAKRRREDLAELERFQQEELKRKAARSRSTGGGSSTTSVASERDAPPGQSRPPPPPGVSAPTPAVPNAAASPASNEDEQDDDFDPNAPMATFTLPADGASLRKKPEAYSGRGEPNGTVIVSVDQSFMEEVPVDRKGPWRVLGAKVTGLKPGQHKATVTSLTPGGKIGPRKVIHFALLSLLAFVLPWRAAANETSLQVNNGISFPCGLVRPPFASLDNPHLAVDGPPPRACRWARILRDGRWLPTGAPGSAMARGEPP